MKRLAAALLATVATLAVLAPISANAVATQTTAALSSTTWTDLGAGPLRLFGSGNTRYAISDSTPAAGILGFAVGDTPIDVVSTSHVWVISADSHFNAFATYAPIASAATPTFSWPGTAVNAAGGTSAGTGTMPYVNAYIVGGGGSGGPLGAQAIANSQAVNPATSSVWNIGTMPAVTLGAGSAAIGGVTVSNFPATQPVSAVALPLPAGAATAANQEVTAAGTSAASAQAVQGVTGGVPQSIKTGAYTSAGASTGQYAVSIASVTTLTVPSGSLAAEVCVETAAARYTDDGTTPTSTVGIPVPAGSCFQYAGVLASFKIIGSGATMDVSYYK